MAAGCPRRTFIARPTEPPTKRYQRWGSPVRCLKTTVFEACFGDLERELFTVGAELATDPGKYDTFKTHFTPLSPEMTAHLEELIDTLQGEVKLPRSFILPGASAASAALDLARTSVRRAEREVVRLKEAGGLTNPEIIRYLNRVGDLLFIVARYEDRHLPMEKLTADE